jgi:hypothetical protein
MAYEPYNFEDENAFAPYQPPIPVPYDPARHREWVRTGLVLLLAITTYGALLLIALLTAFGAVNGDNAAKAAAFLSPVVAAATLAVGFYFHEKSV